VSKFTDELASLFDLAMPDDEAIQCRVPCVYFLGGLLEDRGLVKIGYTSNYSQRAWQISHYAPFSVELHGVLRGGTDVEKRAMRAFKKYKLHGSWYRREGALWQFTRSLEFFDLLGNPYREQAA
jgi:hypothetical protein